MGLAVAPPFTTTSAHDDHRGPDLWLLVPVLGLTAFGVAMVFSASLPFCARPDSRDLFAYLWRELAFVAVGLAAMFGAYRVPLEYVRRSARCLVVLTVILLMGLFPFGTTVNGARCWYTICGLRFQPSELAKLALAIWCARRLARYPQGVPDWRHAFRVLLVPGLVLGLIALEPDAGTALLMGVALFPFLHIGGLKLRQLAAAFALAVPPAGVMLLTHPYQMARITGFFSNQPGVLLDDGYQRWRSLIALGSGGLFGRGYFRGVEKFYYLPEVTTDAILSVIGEELGFVATATVLALFGLLIWRGLWVAARAPDRFSGVLAAGITCLLGVQALVNIAVATGVAPPTGITLPFVSYGGSSLLCSMAAVGLLLNVGRTIPAPAAEEPHLRVIA